MRSRFSLIAVCLLILWVLAGCGSQTPSESPATGSQESAKKSPGLMDRLTSKPVTLAAGTVIAVRLGETLATKSNHSGDVFSATVADPVSADNKVIIPEGSSASGRVVESVPKGRFKGGAKLQIALSSVTINGTKYNIQTSAVSRGAKGKGKRSAIMIGGGAGAGALIGGLVGGGKGAAIGAAAGAGAGTAGAAFTGNQDLTLPAESVVSFKLLQPLTVKM